MPSSVVAAVVTAVVSGSTWTAAAGITIGFSWGAFAGALVLGAASSLLAPKPKGQSADLAIPERQMTSRTLTVQEPISTGKLQYGRLRLGGVRTLVEKTGGDSGSLHMVVTLAANPLAGMDELRFDDESVPLDADGNATGKYAGYAKCWFGDGTEEGDAIFNEKLSAALPDKWTSAHRQTGFAKLYVRLEWSNDLYGGGLPNITAICRCDAGIYDPRTEATGWTDNAALVLARYLTTPQNVGGFGSDFAEIDEAELVAAANICDEMVAIRAKATNFTADAGTNKIALADGNLNLATGSRVRLTSSGTLPGGLAAATDYYFIVDGNLAGKLATSVENANAGTAIDITSAGSGTHTVSIATAFTADAEDDAITLADAGARLRTGMRVRLTTDGTLPAGLALATDYYFGETVTLSGGLATSIENARAGVFVAISDSGTGLHFVEAKAEPRYTANGTVDTAEDPEAAIGNILTAMSGRLVRSGGKWIIRAGAWNTATKTLGQDDLVDGLKVRWRREPREIFNGVKGTFTDPDSAWQATDFPTVAPASFLTEDQAVRAWSSISLPFTTSASMAQRLARIELERNRRQIGTNLPCKLSALDVRGGDTVALDWARYGWDAKTFEVTRFKLATRGDTDIPAVFCDIELAETDANVFAWTPSADESYLTPSPRSNLPSAGTVASPTALALSSGTDELDIRIDGTIFSRIRAAWVMPEDAYVKSGGQIEIQYKKSADADWQPSEFTRGDATFYRILDVADGESYDVRIRARNYLGITSPGWVTQTGHVVIGKTADPSDVTGFSASQNGTRVNFRADQHPDVDLDRIEIRRAPLGVTAFDAATRTANLLRGEALVSEVVPPGDWSFLACAFDTSGNRSSNVTRFDLTIRNPNTIVRQLRSAPDWPGTRTGLVLHPSGVLVPDSTMLAVDMDDAQLWDEFVHSQVATCRYEAPEIDLGFDIGLSQPVRCFAAIQAAMGPGEAGAPIAALELDTRTEAGVYDGFEPWSAGAVQGRRIKSRVTLDPASGVAFLAGFDPTVDAERRSEVVAGVAVDPAGTAVVFAQRFFNPPVVAVQPIGTTARIGQPSAIGATGCIAHLFNTSGTGVSGTADVTADGV